MPDTTPRQTCFIDMPFGRKTDLKSGVEIDFDQIYTHAVEPAVLAAGLSASAATAKTPAASSTRRCSRACWWPGSSSPN